METLRFLRLLRFNRKVALFGSTMMYISKPLLSFGLVFMSGFLAFSTTAYFFFNTYMFDFRTFMATLNTLLSMMLGKLVLTGGFFIIVLGINIHKYQESKIKSKTYKLKMCNSKQTSKYIFSEKIAIKRRW